MLLNLRSKTKQLKRLAAELNLAETSMSEQARSGKPLDFWLQLKL